MRIAHRHGTEHDLLTRNGQRVAGARFRHCQRHARDIEFGHAHVDANAPIGQHFGLYWPARAQQTDSPRGHQATVCQPAHDAAQAVATLPGARAIGVVNAVAERVGRIFTALDGHDLITADTEVPVGERARQLRIQCCMTRPPIEHDKVVADALHLGEAQAHCAVV